MKGLASTKVKLLQPDQLEKPKSEKIEEIDNEENVVFSITESDKKCEAESMDKPDSFKFREYCQFILLLLGTMSYKFSYETVNSAFALIFLSRLPTYIAITLVAVSNVVNCILQSISSTFVNVLVKRMRASLLLGISLILFGLSVGIIVVIELCTGGSFWTGRIIPGTNLLPMFILVVQLFCGISFGMVDILRKLIPPLIAPPARLGNANVYNRMNSLVHIFYEISGTGGAFASAGFIIFFGEVYCLLHVPIFFTLSGIFMMCIIHDFKNKKEKEELLEEVFISKKEKYLVNPLKKIGKSIGEYFRLVWKGFKISFFKKEYNFLPFCIVFPQVLHRIKENLFIPTYSKDIIHKSWFVGLLLGGSNFGELGGAMVIFISSFCKFKLNSLFYVNFGMVALNLIWIFPFLDWNSIKSDYFPILESIIVISMIIISSGFSAGDISLLSYVQQIPNKEDTAATLSFLFFMFVVAISVSSLLLGQICDQFNVYGNLPAGFSFIIGIITISTIIVVIASFFGYINMIDHSTENKKKDDKPELIIRFHQPMHVIHTI